ncbi:MAG: DrmB family protein [Candidatus Hydrogenedentota bacterium]
MISKTHGQIRQGQVITTYGPGALIDLPRHSGIVGGLETWPKTSDLRPIHEPRLTDKLRSTLGVNAPRLFAPPPESNNPSEKSRGIGVWRFPEWFLVQEKDGEKQHKRSRRLVHRKALDEKGGFDGQKVVPTRFVRACPKGHVEDLNWRGFVHGADNACRQQPWLDERGTSGDLADFVVRCECGKSRRLYEAAELENKPLGTCRGARPWLGINANEDCDQPSRLLIRTASNAYFPQVVSVLSIPEQGSAVEKAVKQQWEILGAVNTEAELTTFKRIPAILDAIGGFSDTEVLAAIQAIKRGKGDDRPARITELDALLAAPEGFGDDVPINHDFHARRLPERIWRTSQRSQGIESVIQLHRLREVLALIGFTRFEAETPDINGEYPTDVQRADLAREPQWFPAVENRGEGVFIQLRSDAVAEWLGRDQVAQRLDDLSAGHEKWMKKRKRKTEFPGGPYVLLHTLSHLLLQALAVRCGYPASSIRERIYADKEAERFGILLYTGSPVAEGTLGGLVQEARRLEEHLTDALRTSALCSNDPICAQHTPAEGRLLHGAACHGCALIAETTCEMHNEYLDRALVVPVLGVSEAAFFPAVL